MKRVLTLVAAAAVVIGALPAFAQEVPTAEVIVAQAPPASTLQLGAPQNAERAALRLTDAQLEQLRALKDKYFADNTMKRAQLKVLKGQLRSEMTKETIDRNAVLGVQAKINALQADISNARIAQMLDASAVFTPEQRKAMHSRMLRRGMGFGGQHGGKRFHGGKRGHCGGRRGDAMTAPAGPAPASTIPTPTPAVEG